MTAIPCAAGIYAQVQSQALSNGMPVLDLDGRWDRGYEPSAGTQRAYQTLQAEAGLRLSWPAAQGQGPWRLGWVKRAQAFARLSGPAADVVALYQGQRDPTSPRTFQIDADVRSWRGQGIALHPPAWGTADWTVSASAQWLQLDRLRRTTAHGTAAYNADQSYDHDLTLSDANPRLVPPFAQAADRHGQGWSLSLALNYRPQANWEASLQVADIASSLRWRNVQVDESTLQSNITTRTPDGYINYEPAIQGQYVRRSVSQRIPMAVQAQWLWHRPEADWFVQAHHQWGLSQAWVGARTTGPWRWSLAVDATSGALAAGLQWGAWQLQLSADRLDQAAHVRSVQLVYGVE